MRGRERERERRREAREDGENPRNNSTHTEVERRAKKTGYKGELPNGLLLLLLFLFFSQVAADFW